MKCPYCGSEKIEPGVAWGKTTGVSGPVGLKYQAGPLVGTAQVYSDLCLVCGTLLRTYIKEDPNRKWSHKSGFLGGK